MNASIANMVTRTINAEDRFIASVVDNGFTAEEAKTIASVYVHVGVLTYDAVDGQFYIRHGAMMERETMANALANSASALAGRKCRWKRR